MSSLAEASLRRSERLVYAELDRRLDLLLADLHGPHTPDPHFARVTANPRSMGYLRFLLRHYAKSKTPWTDCVRDNTKRFGPDRTKALCLAPTTPVSTERGLVEIADLREGDLVWSFSGDGFVLRPILWAGCTRRDAKVMKIEVDGSVEICATPDHPFLRYRGDWAEAQDLRVGEFLLGPLPSSVLAGGFSTASSTVSLTLADSAGANAEILRPRMSMRAVRSVLDLLTPSLNLFVLLKNLGDLLLSSRRHQWFNDAHDRNGMAIVDSPLIPIISSLRLGSQHPDLTEPEGISEPLERLREVLSSDYAEVPTAGAVSQLTLRSVEAKAPFALQETSGVSDVLGRQITEVSLLEEGIDVWDIEVGDTHNFIVHDFIIAHNCGVLKDTIRQNTLWRHGPPVGPHPGHPDAGAPGVAIGEADKWAAPAWGGHHLSEDRPLSLLDDLDLEFGVVDHSEHLEAAADALCELGRRCDVFRVLIGLDESPDLGLREAA